MSGRPKLNAQGRRPNRVRFFRADPTLSSPIDHYEKEDRVLLPGMIVWAQNDEGDRLGVIVEVEDESVRIKYHRPRPVGAFDAVDEEVYARFGRDGWALARCFQLHETQPMAVEIELLKQRFPDRH